MNNILLNHSDKLGGVLLILTMLALLVTCFTPTQNLHYAAIFAVIFYAGKKLQQEECR